MKRYLAGLMITTVLGLCAIAAVNFAVDASTLFSARATAREAAIRAYVERLVSSVDGLVHTPQDRAVKLALADISAADCFVLGSSHIMQVGKSSMPDLFASCAAVANLGVSGGALFEDIAMMTARLMERRRKLHLFIGVDVWSLRKDPGMAWAEESDAFERAAVILGIGRGRGGAGGRLAVWASLVSGDYLLHNIKALGRKRPEETGTVPIRLAAAAGFDEAVTRPDGTRRYSEKRMKTPPRALAPNEDGSYRIYQPIIHPAVRDDFERTMMAARAAGLQITLLLTPYHPRVLACSTAGVCEALREVETYVRELGRNIGLPVVGSFDSRAFGFAESDFMDEHHLFEGALSRLRVLASNPWQ